MHKIEINPNVSIMEINVNRIKFTSSKDKSFKLNEETTHTRSSYMPFMRQVTKEHRNLKENRNKKKYEAILIIKSWCTYVNSGQNKNLRRKALAGINSKI